MRQQRGTGPTGRHGEPPGTPYRVGHAIRGTVLGTEKHIGKVRSAPPQFVPVPHLNHQTIGQLFLRLGGQLGHTFFIGGQANVPSLHVLHIESQLGFQALPQPDAGHRQEPLEPISTLGAHAASAARRGLDTDG
jgi:hypothetical protein